MSIIGANVLRVRTSTEGPEFPVGSIQSDDTTGKKYKYVKFNNGTGDVASVANRFCYYYGTTGTTVTMDLSDSLSIGAGVFQAVIADGGYGWIQVTGVATLGLALTAGSAGTLLTPVGATDGTLDAVIATAADSMIAAYCIDVTTPAAPIIVLSCPL